MAALKENKENILNHLKVKKKMLNKYFQKMIPKILKLK
jgi:hypothetical protein